MGDRGNIEVKDGKGSVFLYSHWDGSELPKILANALDRAPDRVDDGPYITRVIFCEMVKDDVEGTTGYGITWGSWDRNHDDIVFDVEAGTVDGVPVAEFIRAQKEGG